MAREFRALLYKYDTIKCYLHSGMGPLKCYVTQLGGGGVSFPEKKRYKGVRFNVIIVTRGWVGVTFPEKNPYVTLEWPLWYDHDCHLISVLFHLQMCLGRSVACHEVSISTEPASYTHILTCHVTGAYVPMVASHCIASSVRDHQNPLTRGSYLACNE